MRALGVAALLAGCGLVSSDIARISLRLPEKDFTIDATAWGLPSGGVPPVACPPFDCAAVCAAAPCRADCDAATQLCQAHVTVTAIQDYNLASEGSGYQQIGAQSLISVGIDTVYIQVTQSSLNVATPQLSVYLAPMGATSASDPSAQLVGTIAPIPPGATGSFSLDFAAGGQDILKSYMLDHYQTPFRAIVVGVEDVHAGDAAPRGKLVGAVGATAHASLGP